jgi:CPA2 family monovalent cation:H+ antiporter-2
MINDLALILIVASVVTLLFKWLKQPLVLGYIVAGFLVSHHMPYLASVADGENIQTWADIGVLFLLFTLGLEFSFKKILKMGMAPFIAAITIIFSMLAIGITVGHAFGWGKVDCVFLGGMLCMSSTTIIYKAFTDLGLRQQRFASLVMSVLILEDVMAIIMMVMLSTFALGGHPDGSVVFMSILKILFFLVLWFMVGLFVIPWLLRSTRKLMTDETLVVLSLGLCFAMAVFSVQVGFSSAFGAFVMGSILAETVEAEKIANIVSPVKDLFGAIFFVSVGMLVEPSILVNYAGPITGLVAAIIIGQAVFGSMGFLLSGQTLKTAMRCGFSMAQIGEFAFIIASLGLSLGVISKFLYPVVVAVSVVTTFLTPYMVRLSVPAHDFLESRLPKVWIKRLNRLGELHSGTRNEMTLWQSLLRQMTFNTFVFVVLSIAGIAMMFSFAMPFIRTLLPMPWSNIVCCAATLLVIAPFLRAIIAKKMHSVEFRTLWTQNRINRLPLIFTVLIRMIIALALVFYVVQHLFKFTSAIVFSVALAVVLLIIASRTLKHNSIRMERLFIENLRSREVAAQVSGKRRPLFEGKLLDRSIHIAELTVPADSAWAGKSLAQLELGKRFGVHVSSILRGRQRINIPGGESILFPSDRLSVIGNDDQITELAHVMDSELVPEDKEIEKREMKLLQVTLRKNSPIIGKSLAESGLRKNYGVMLVGLEQGQENLTLVNIDHVFNAGDVLWVVGERETLKHLSI